MDCFYAQVEMRDRPELMNVPLAIGGAPGTRSVLCTSNYIARKFGVKSAMPTDFAVRLCPKLVVLPPNFKKYKEASEIVQNIFLKYSSKVETVSLDEATSMYRVSLMLQKLENVFRQIYLKQLVSRLQLVSPQINSWPKLPVIGKSPTASLLLGT